MLLSICIPTYNRCAKLEGLLSFLYDEIMELEEIDVTNNIEVVISNNHSTDDSENVILNSMLYNSKEIRTHYVSNETNLGLAGNLGIVYKTAIGKYVWLMGDDDIYEKGILRRVYLEVAKDEYSFIFINHSIYIYAADGGKSGFESVVGDVDIRKGNKEILLEIFKYSGTSLMFISASVHRRINVVALLQKYELDMATPLCLSFFSATKGKVNIIKDVLIDDTVKGLSWSDSAYRLFHIEVPRVLFRLPGMGYSKRLVYPIIINYLWKRKRSYISHFIKELIGLK